MKIVIVEDHRLFRAMLAESLTHRGIDVVGQADNAGEALALIGEATPDAAIIDLGPSGNDYDEGLRLAEQVRGGCPEVGLLILAGRAEPPYVERLLSMPEPAQALGYLLKRQIAGVDEIVHALHRIVRNELVIDPRLVRLMMSRHREEDPMAVLTSRERDILALVATGWSNKGIAHRLPCAISTVEKNLSTIFTKLGLVTNQDEYGSVNRRVQATLIYIRNQAHSLRFSCAQQTGVDRVGG